MFLSQQVEVRTLSLNHGRFVLTIDLFVYYASERREGVLSLNTICSLNAEEE